MASKSVVPLAEVLQLTLGFSLNSTEKITLAQAIEFILKSGSSRKAALVADLLSRFGFSGEGMGGLEIWAKFEDVPWTE